MRQARYRRDGRSHMRQAQGYIIPIIIPAGNSSAGTLTTGFPRPSMRIFFRGTIRIGGDEAGEADSIPSVCRS